MKNRIRIVTYILAFIMPFILGCVILAAGPFDGETLNIVRHDWVNKDNDIVYACSYAFEMPNVSGISYNNNDGTVNWNGQRYGIKIIYEVKSGDDVRQSVVISDRAGLVSGKKNYSHNVAYMNNSGILQDKIVKDGLKIVLTPENGGGEIIDYVSAEVKNGTNGEIAHYTIGQRDNVGLLAAAAGMSPILNWIGWADYRDTVTFIAETLAAITLPTGDSILHMVSLAVGETVTIDRLVYDEINKTDIDFFSSSNVVEGKSAPLKSMLADTVNTWYDFFRKIALMFYLILLVYLGFKLILTSTAEKKADYKLILTAWVMGIAMLFCFPYAMKYTIKINHAACTFLRNMMSTIYEGNATLDTVSDDLINKSIGEMTFKYGRNVFVSTVMGYGNDSDTFELIAIPENKFGSNAMMRIRFIAGVNKDLPLTVIYFIMIGQLIALLIMYYKRVFMLSFLITMFPLVCIIYPLNKIGDIKINSFGTWFKEFLVNVFVQTFHAATYSVVVSIGVNAYLEDDNWLFMLMCILFLFEGEKIIRGLFNAKSATGSIGDLAASGALAWSVLGKAKSFIPSIDIKSKADNSETGKEKAKKDRDEGSNPTSSPSTPPPGSGLGGSTGNPGNGGPPTQVGPTMQGENAKDGIELGRNINSNDPASKIKKAVGDKEKGNNKTWGSRIAKGAASTIGWGAQNLVGAPLGGLIGLTAGLAQTDAKNGMKSAVEGTVSGYALGKDIGGGVSSIISTATNHISSKVAGIAVGKSIMSGGMDKELGIDDAVAGLDEAAAREREKAIRKVFAKAAKRSETGMQIKIAKETIKRTIN